MLAIIEYWERSERFLGRIDVGIEDGGKKIVWIKLETMGL